MRNCASGKSAIFTNINGDFTICEVETQRLEENSLVEEMKAIDGFKCLEKNASINTNEYKILIYIKAL